jgi:hypothetical protein
MVRNNVLLDFQAVRMDVIISKAILVIGFVFV